MEYRLLGGSGLKVPVFALGTGSFGGTSETQKAFGGADEVAAIRLVDLCIDAGVTFFDTADIYTAGVSEQILGKAFRGRRDKVLISTKGSQATGAGPNDRGSSRFHLTAAVEASLRRLGTDYIDLYQLHAYDALTPPEETLSTLDQLVRSRQDPLHRLLQFPRLVPHEIASRLRPLWLAKIRRPSGFLFAGRPRL